MEEGTFQQNPKEFDGGGKEMRRETGVLGWREERVSLVGSQLEHGTFGKLSFQLAG